MSLLTDTIAEDINDAFLNTDDFAEEVIYFESGKSGKAITIIWDEAFEVIDAQTEVRSFIPVCFAKESDISGNGEGDKIVRNSTNYYITNIIGQNNQGTVLLTLSRRSIHG